MSFARAAEHLENYTAGHETKTRAVGPERIDYPDDHVEVDNRLSWFLGSLARRYDETETFYVHLTRDAREVAESYLRRWDSVFRSSIVRAFGHGVLIRNEDWPMNDRREVVHQYVQTINDNITEFLCTRESMTIDITELSDRFADFAERIGGIYDQTAVQVTLARHHNAS